MIGINVSCLKVSLQRIRIIGPVAAGILLDSKSADIMDFGGSDVLNSMGDGVIVLKRQKAISLT